MYELAIIGSGPAGLAATMYAIRKGMDVQLIAGHLGGKSSLTMTFPEIDQLRVLKAREQVQIFRSRIEYLTHTWRDDRVSAVQELPDAEGFEIQLVKGGAIAAERLVVATGVHAAPLGVPGESDFQGRALGSSAISYTHALRDRDICVIGDSDRVIEAALEASIQASHTHLVMLEGTRCSEAHLALALANDTITVYRDCRVSRFDGDQFARSVTISSGEIVSGTPEAEGADTAPTSTGEVRIEAGAFFVEREPRPRSEIVSHLVDCDPAGAIRVNERNETSHERIYAAGDVTTVGVEQILVALGEGARASLSAYRRMTLQGK
jgi:NADH-dependent peroxiredoxin subunit F